MGTSSFYTLGWHVPVPPDILMEPLLTPEQLAATLGLSVQTLYNRRARGESLPPCIKLGGRLRYLEADVRVWLDAQREVAQETPWVQREPKPTSGLTGPRKRGRPRKDEEIHKRLDKVGKPSPTKRIASKNH